MELKWELDINYTDCWDLRKNGKKFGFTIRESGDIGWYLYMSPGCTSFPGRTIDEVKAIVEALVLLEG